MTLKDVLNAVSNKRRFWLKFDWNWEKNVEGNIIPTTKVVRNLNSEVSVHYQWFHHMNNNIDTKEIWRAIETHNYSAFVKWYNRLKDEEFTYLPTDAQIWIEDECIGSVVVVYDEKTFNLITSQDFECG